MPSSDSEDFESADEGQTHMERKERKKRLSSSNYSDNALDSDLGPKETSSKGGNVEKPKEETKDGWDDFDIDNNELDDNVSKTAVSKKENEPKAKESTKSQDTGWDDFDDWGQDDFTSNEPKKTEPAKPVQQEPDAKIKEVTERLASASTKSNSWGWGWGVDSLLSTATAGITTLTNQVSQGITTVLETGIGAPDPEELARKNMREAEAANKTEQTTPGEVQEKAEMPASSEAAFPFGSLFSGVTKFVETTGTKVIAGGLDTLETIGKKTMEVLQDGDPGLAKKRAMLGLDSGDKPVLSQILREAKAKAEEEDKVREEKREAKEVHYERLFDDFEGLVHLEALEMLSRQVSLRIEERMRGLDPAKRQDIKETMQQVAELCEMPEEDDDDEEPVSEDMSKADAFHERLQTATQDLGLKLQFQPLVKQYTDVLEWLETAEPLEKGIYKRAVSSLAQCTALAVLTYHKAAEMLLVKPRRSTADEADALTHLAQCTALAVLTYHKAAEMLLVKPRRSTADEADALTQMTVVLTKHVSELATLFTEKLNSINSENKEQINNYITNIFLEAGNSSTYIQNAFQLALPILQIGAV